MHASLAGRHPLHLQHPRVIFLRVLQRMLCHRRLSRESPRVQALAQPYRVGEAGKRDLRVQRRQGRKPCGGRGRGNTEVLPGGDAAAL